MIRVLHLLQFLHVGGVEEMVRSLCKHRNRGEFEYAVVVPWGGVMAEEFRQTGVPVYVGWEWYPVAIKHAEIINVHWGYYDPPWHHLVRSSGKPYVTTLHCATVMPKLPAVTICTAEHVYRIQKHKSRCVLIPNGVDVSRFSRRPRLPGERVVITRVCRPDRCALYFWEAMEKVLRRYPQTELWIVGNETNPGRPSERIRFLGVRRDIPEILARSDIFAYTPYPNIGTKDLVVMEASAAGVPCVVSDVRCVRESVKDRKNGFLVPFGDIETFVERIGLLIEDVALRIHMGEEAVRIARERFDMRDVAQRYEAVYRTVLDVYRESRVNA